jgi:hypothetical protein
MVNAGLSSFQHLQSSDDNRSAVLKEERRHLARNYLPSDDWKRFVTKKWERNSEMSSLLFLTTKVVECRRMTTDDEKRLSKESEQNNEDSEKE